MLESKLVAIAGGSCTGKSTIAEKLRNDERTIFSQDDMFVGFKALEGQNITDWEDPGLYRWEDMTQHLRDLKSGRSVLIQANEAPGRKTPEMLLIEPKPVIMVVGFLVLHHPEIREMLDTAFYLDAPEEVIRERRIERALTSHSWDNADYIDTIMLPGHRRLVVPQRDMVDPAHVIDATQHPDDVVQQVDKLIEASR